MKPNYFDMTVHDIDKARKFFGDVFGWRFKKYEASFEYYTIEAGKDDEPGINGGIGLVKHAPISEGRPLTQITVQVEDIESYVKKVRQGGGYVFDDKLPIPGVGWYATCAEPGGLKFGLFQKDPTVE